MRLYADPESVVKMSVHPCDWICPDCGTEVVNDRVVVDEGKGLWICPACNYQVFRKFHGEQQEGDIRMEDDKRDIALLVAFRYLGKPYIWSGDNPNEGFDCSGFVIECLKSVGILARKGDWTAEQLYRMWITNESPDADKGCLVFWENDEEPPRMVHVEMCLDKTLSIGASGGGSKTTSLSEAIAQDAYVKIRPWANRGGKVRFVDPFI